MNLALIVPERKRVREAEGCDCCSVATVVNLRGISVRNRQTCATDAQNPESRTMPNTLAHIGVQSFVSRSVWRAADFRWIFLGVVVPDLPWILSRLVRGFGPEIDPFTFRAYTVAQSSLLLSAFLCGALALLSTRPRQIFALLCFNSFIHLLLDASQTKWGNGVHLLAPVSWNQLNFGFFWPESLPTYLITALGGAAVLWAWLRRKDLRVGVRPKGVGALFLATLLVAAYVYIPSRLVGAVQSSNSHSIGILKHVDARSGRAVAFDRVRYRHTDEGDWIDYWGRERIRIDPPVLDRDGVVSIRARFREPSTLHVTDVHEHRAWPRDLWSYIGLTCVLLAWAWRPIGGCARRITSRSTLRQSEPRADGFP
jgi:hypothetical protein